MLYWAATFFIIAIVAGVFGFGGIAAASAGVAQILFYLFLIGFLISVGLHFVSSTERKSNKYLK